MSTPKIIVVIGATGSQGGSVVSRFLQNPSFRIRALTRSPTSPTSQSLSSKGVEVVSADVSDPSTLGPAFTNAYAIFANIATAASKVEGLKHFVISTLPSAERSSGGTIEVPHFDYKARAAGWIRKELPELWEVTTEFWSGMYTSNLALLPILKPIEVPGSQGGYTVPLPGSPDTLIPYAGDLEHNVGVVVEAIINSGSKAYGKIAVLATDYLTWAEGYAAIEKLFPEKRIALSKIDREQFIKLWGEWGVEIADQMAWNDEFTDWKALAGERFFGLEELGIKEGEITTTTTTTVEGQLGSSNANGTGCIALGALLGRSLAGTALTLGLGLAPLLFPDEEADHLALVSGMLALHLEDLGLSHERSLGRRVHGRAAGAGNAAHIVVENIAHQVLIRNSKAKSVHLHGINRYSAEAAEKQNLPVKSDQSLLINTALTKPHNTAVIAKLVEFGAMEAWNQYSHLWLYRSIRNCMYDNVLAVLKAGLHALDPGSARSGHGDFKDYHERFEHEDALLTCFCGSWKNPFHPFFCRKAYAVSPVTGEAATRENLSLAIGIYWQRFIARIQTSHFFSWRYPTAGLSRAV
ncbi:unnamed protein product [Sordaria macrospora k-hell]|uniref:WGS project CABT00000000 data, contig 2.133 n=1 Tax=Sordaria macrospora (strain ATCC MYA-333 / DSM 997 / K(L3346) / K-hell) TaxID=771870 RepID=F7WCH1_SORMK|nr:uncharacterized protein SMAC_09640 [Sordaria macrospora k-hell]CCC05615.1 unnamed protein product [Sordaria macrospora k-hell]